MTDVDSDKLSKLFENMDSSTASRDLLNYINGPLQSIQNRLIQLIKDMSEVYEQSPSQELLDVHNKLSGIGYDLNAQIFYMLTGADIEGYIGDS